MKNYSYIDKIRKYTKSTPIHDLFFEEDIGGIESMLNQIRLY